MVKTDAFRQDLLYLLNTACVELPPLRKRGNDITLLAHHFVHQFAAEFKKSILSISIEGQEKLLSHDWPGNVRELRNVIERAVLFEDGHQLTEENISIFRTRSQIDEIPEVRKQSGVVDFPTNGLNLKNVEEELVRKALKQADGNKTKAAKLLGISKPTLYARLKKYE